MKAWRVAIRPTSRRKKRNASGQGDEAQRSDPEQDGEATAHEQEQEVAGQDVGEKSNRERDQAGDVRDRLDPEEEGLGEDVHVLEPGREPAREVGEEALRPDPLDVVRATRPPA